MNAVLGLFFEYDPPVVTSISTDHGSIAGGLAITVTGYGFGMADTQPAVSIGLSPCEEDSWISDTSMRCTTPAGQVRACVTRRQRRRSVVWCVRGGRRTKGGDARAETSTEIETVTEIETATY